MRKSILALVSLFAAFIFIACSDEGSGEIYMKIEEVIKNYADDLEYIEIRLERDCGDSKDYMKGMLDQARKTLSRNLGFADDSDRIMRPITRREKRTYRRRKSRGT